MTKNDHAGKRTVSVFELPTPNASNRDAFPLIFGGVLGLIVSAIAIYIR
jgi:hypothetical protein